MSFPLPGGGGEALWTSGTCAESISLRVCSPWACIAFLATLKTLVAYSVPEVVACAFNLHRFVLYSAPSNTYVLES